MGALFVWGDFEVHSDKVLGRGGMGSVYRAWQRSVGRWVAVKVLDADASRDPVLLDGFPQKFKVEIAALAKLNDPRIVSIIQAGENEGRFWFAMELLEGRTLEARLNEPELLEEAEARRLGGDVARALGAAWRAGIVHRDVKPGNIFLLKDGGVKLADFGLARGDALGRTRLTEAGAFACTPAYASPEQIEGRPCDHRSDIYSLGCVLYEMLTQRPPFVSDNSLDTFDKHKLLKPVAVRDLNPAVSEDYEALVFRCLEKHPDDRWKDYDALIEALDRPRPASVKMGTSPAADLPALPPPAAPRRSSRVLGAFALAGLASFAWLLSVVLDAGKPGAAVEAAAALRRPEPLSPPLPKVAPPAPSFAPPPPARPEEAPAEAETDVLHAKEPLSRAGPGEAAEALRRFTRSLSPNPDLELVGEVAWGGWVPDTFQAPGGTARWDGAAYVLSARRPGDLVWIKKPFAGARRGYQVSFSFPIREDGGALALALSFTRWIDISSTDATLRSAEGAVRRLPLGQEIRGGRLSVAPQGAALMIWLEERLLFVLDDVSHEAGMQVGALGGTVRIESVRVKDRTR